MIGISDRVVLELMIGYHWNRRSGSLEYAIWQAELYFGGCVIYQSGVQYIPYKYCFTITKEEFNITKEGFTTLQITKEQFSIWQVQHAVLNKECHFI